MYIDGKKVNKSDYTSYKGSTLSPEYMRKLSTGKHTVVFTYDYDLSASGSFTVARRKTVQVPAGNKGTIKGNVTLTSDKTVVKAGTSTITTAGSVATGDANSMADMFALIIGAASVCVMITKKRKAQR